MLEKEEGAIIEQFIESMFRMMLDHHRSHVVEMDLTVIQVETLALLSEAPVPATRLAASLGISGPAMTQLTDRLVRKRLIERRPLKEDRRTVMVALTDQGVRVVHSFRKRRGVVFAGALSRLSASDQVEVVEALNKLLLAIEETEPHKAKRVSQRASQRASHDVSPEALSERTAVIPPAASNEAGPKTATLPVRRMRIEWD